VAAHARSAMPGSATKVVFNPGYRAPMQLFAYADLIVEFEDSYAKYLDEGVLGEIPEGVRGKSAVQVYDTPGEADVGGLIGAMVAGGVGAVYFGEDCCYKVWNRGLLEKMAEAV